MAYTQPRSGYSIATVVIAAITMLIFIGFLASVVSTVIDSLQSGLNSDTTVVPATPSEPGLKAVYDQVSTLTDFFIAMAKNENVLVTLAGIDLILIAYETVWKKE